MSVTPQDFGALTPGIRYAEANGITAGTAAQIYTKYTVFETVAPGAIAQLPATNAAYVEIIIMNRCGTGEVLTVIPDSGGQIESYGPSGSVGVADGGNATFVCLDQVISPGRQWWVK